MPNSIITTPVKTEVFRTAESVSPKHPDKICDQISDAILDAHLAEDPYARVAVDVSAIVHRIVGPKADGTPLEIIESIEAQSTEIAQGVNEGGAGDQGIMVGYATSETPEYLPLEYVLARNLNKFLYKQWPYDGKTQITLLNGEVIAVVASFQHAVKAELTEKVHAWLKQEPLVTVNNAQLNVHVNPAGDWEVGGFDADSGLTGRKLAVDNYGPRVPLGGGAFSGKDGTKVDRSGAYIARKIAVDYLKSHDAHEVYVYLAYAIGYPYPVEASVNIDGVQQKIDGYNLTPEGIIQALDLRTPGYEIKAQYGHF